ncbi:ABC transporter permease [Granulosicoccus antarcticus]|uniref:Sulfate transport system permease protein CysW n=1 Tax=Granulosicoccus antarcticus IMCC3135 TaxID=1192854 RepID=A0A2Z2NR83_9GAMM|nr:iron ABC transporter permease [Granulosicoccus antarcticus]ASJ72511.1 Sulfate transport system permease protein CysW [Granulosicoccus antarcticus IMCC3135]
MTANKPVTGRVKARWGSSAAYPAATPTVVSWPDGELEPRRFVPAGPPALSNTAVHPDNNKFTAPKIRYRKSSSEPLKTTGSVAHTGKPTSRAAFLQHREVSERSALPSISGWSVIAFLIALTVCLPILSVIWLSFNPQENIWPHLVNTVLGSYIWNTLMLMLGVAAGTLTIGVSSAWLVTHYEFPGRTWFNWALLLPFAIPAYVIAFIYTDLLEFAGPVQSTLRDLFGWKLANEYWFPRIRTLPGAILMLVLVLYPYVYLLARSAFLEQSASVLEAARVLGGPTKSLFFRVALPMARPAIVVGLAMAMMETLNDFGTVDYFAVRTLTAGLYDVWLGMNNLGGGAQIATLLLVFVMMLIGMEKISRRHQQNYQPTSTRFRKLTRHQLRGTQAFFAFCACLLPILFGFLIPAWVLVDYAIIYFDESWTADFRQIALNSVLLSGTAAIAAVSIGIVLSYSQRLHPTRLLRTSVNVSSLGYAVPGAVLAIGVIIPFATFDNTLDAFMRSQFGFSTGLLLSGTVFALVFAYTVRFLAVAYGSVDASMKKISPHMDDAARSLGHSSGSILTRIHLPLMKSGVLTAALVVFVDCMKELPATLVLRPFNFDTLATHVYQFASDELIGEASLGALLIVLTGLAPVILLTTTIDRSRELKAAGVTTIDEPGMIRTTADQAAPAKTSLRNA